MKLNIFLAVSLISLAGCKDVPPPIAPLFPTTETSPYTSILADPVDSVRIEAGITGLAIGILEGEDLAFEGYYGLQSIDGSSPVNRNSRFTAGPLSGMVTAIGVLQLLDQGSVDLDTHVGEYLPYDIRHPNFPQANISLRMLLSHVSGIRDDSTLLASLVVAGDANDDIEGFVESYLTPQGNLFSSTHFDTDRPGKTYNYSSVGLAVAALVIESIEGIPFSIWCQTNAFAKLGFSTDGWFLDNIAAEDVVSPHIRIGSNTIAQLPYGYPQYSSGLLRVNLRGASRLWRSLMLGGAYGDQRFFGQEENTILQSIPFPFSDPAQGFGWRLGSAAGSPVWMAGGEDLGFTSIAYFDPAANVGVVILSNGGGLDTELAYLGQIALEAARNF